jgi:hypothetical protein
MFLSKPRATKGKTSPDLYAEKTSGLLTYIIHPCIPYPLASRCQLVPLASSPLAQKLLNAAAALPVPDRFTSPPPPPLSCSCRHPRTAPAAVASPYHRLRPVPSGTRAARRRCTPPPSLRECRRRCLRSCFRLPQQQAAVASPCSRLRPLPVRALPPPPLLFPPSPADRASAAAAAARGSFPGYPTLGTTYVAATAAPVAASIPRPSKHQPLPPLALFSLIRPHPRQELRLINCIIKISILYLLF